MIRTPPSPTTLLELVWPTPVAVNFGLHDLKRHLAPAVLTVSSGAHAGTVMQEEWQGDHAQTVMSQAKRQVEVVRFPA